MIVVLPNGRASKDLTPRDSSPRAPHSTAHDGSQHGRERKASSLSPARIRNLPKIFEQIPRGCGLHRYTSLRKDQNQNLQLDPTQDVLSVQVDRPGATERDECRITGQAAAHDKCGGKWGQSALRLARLAFGTSRALGGVPGAAKCRFCRAWRPRSGRLGGVKAVRASCVASKSEKNGRE
jgi:hypothetical protein